MVRGMFEPPETSQSTRAPVFKLSMSVFARAMLPREASACMNCMLLLYATALHKKYSPFPGSIFDVMAILVAITITAEVAAWALFAWASFAHVDRTAVQLFAIELLDSSLSLFVAAHLNKAEPFAAVSVAVDNNLGRDHIASASEELSEVIVSCAKRERANK